MKEMFSISSGSNIAKVKPILDSSKELKTDGKSSSSKDFLSIMFAHIKASIGIEKDTLETKTDVIVDEKAPKKSLDEHLLGEILEVISLLKSSVTDKPSFPNYSNKIEKLLTNEVALKELKDVKNLTDLFKLSKKYDLGLEKISVKKLTIESFKNEFPNLDKKSFFETPKEVATKITDVETKKTPGIKSQEISIRDIQKPVQKIEKETSMLEKAMNSSSTKIPEVKTVVEAKVTEIKTLVEAKVTEIKTVVEAKVAETKKANHDNKEVDVKITEIKTVLKNAQEEVPKVLQTQEKKEIKSKVIKEDLDLPKNIIVTSEEKVSTTTRVNEPKIEKDIPKKGLIENILQSIKTDKPLQLDKTNVISTVEKTTEAEDSTAEGTEPKNESITSKLDLKSLAKLDVTTNKQTMNTRETFSNFANDLKEKMENYKPPITRIQMALNPKELGSVDVVLVTRGNALHVSIVSNTNTMSLFTQNQAEFKNSLVNMGFSGLEMNFSDQREGNKEQHKNSFSSGEFSENLDEQNLEEGTSSIELIVPQYV